MSKYNATLSYPVATNKSKAFGIWIMKYEQGHRVGGSSAQSKWFKHFYPRGYAPGAITVTGRVPNQYTYDLLAEFVRGHQEFMIQSAGASNLSGRSQVPLLHLALPSENIYVDGWVDAFNAGAKRFNPAPEFTFEFSVIKDNHSKNYELTPSYALRAWWTGKTIDTAATAPKITDTAEPSDDLGNAYFDPGSSKRG